MKINNYLCGAAAILKGEKFQPHVGPTKDVPTQIVKKSTHRSTTSMAPVLNLSPVRISSGQPLRMSNGTRRENMRISLIQAYIANIPKSFSAGRPAFVDAKGRDIAHNSDRWFQLLFCFNQ